MTPSQINLFADHRRNLGAIDPFLREMHVGLGCALENLLVAAEALGYTTQVDLLPDPSDATWVARVDLAPGPSVISDLYPVIPQRHANRYPYDTGHPVSDATLGALSALGNDPAVQVFWFACQAVRKRVANLLVDAARALVADKTQDGDSARWYRATWQAIQQYRDGITLDAAGLPDWERALGKMHKGGEHNIVYQCEKTPSGPDLFLALHQAEKLMDTLWHRKDALTLSVLAF